MSAAWDVFVASLDLEQVEQERMRVHGDLRAERFGSREHQDMVHAHEYVVTAFWQRMRGEMTDLDREVMRRRVAEREHAIEMAADELAGARERDARLLLLDHDEIDEILTRHPRGLLA